MPVVKPHRVHGTENERSEPSVRDLAQVLERSGDAVIVKDLDAVVTYWNREAASLYGFSAEEAIGQPLRKLHAAELSEADYASLLARVRAGRATSSTTERRKKSGEIVRVTLKTMPLLNGQGALVGEITIARDITAMYQTEEALRRAERELRLHTQDPLPRFAVPLNLKEPIQIRRAPSKAHEQARRGRTPSCVAGSTRAKLGPACALIVTPELGDLCCAVKAE